MQKTKVILYGLFVVTVLLISGLAKAEVTYQVPVRIDRVVLDQQNMEINVMGKLPSPCHGQPAASLSIDPKSPDVLVVRLTSSLPQDGYCIAPIRPFHTAVNLSKLVRASNVPVNERETYIVRTEGFEFEAELPGTQLNRVN